MPTPTRAPHSPPPWALVLWLTGLVLTLALALQMHRSNEQAAQQRFERLVDELARGVQERFGLYELGLRGARGAVLAAGGMAVQNRAFAAYANSRELEREFPGARGFGLIQRVPRSEETRFVAQMRAQGLGEFAVRELAAHPHERYVIRAIEPEALNRQALGLDIASDTNRREAARQAALSGEARLTAPVTLMQAAESPRRGFLLLLPVYAEGADLSTPGARERAVQGWVYAPLVVDAVLRSLGAGLDEVHIRLVDQAERSPFFRTDAEGDRSGIGLSTQRQLRIMGRNWQLQADAQPALLAAAQPRSPAAVLAVGGALSSLGALLLGVLLRQRQQQLQALGLPEREAAHPLRAFATSRLTLGALLLWLLGVLAYMAAAQSEIRARRAADLARHLQGQAQQLVTQREQQREARRKVLAFLAETPPVLGLWRAQATGIDPLDGSDRAHWQRRMQQIFSAHLRTAPEVLSLSLRYLDRPDSEGLTVQRLDGHLVLREGAEPAGPEQALALRQPPGTLFIAPPRAGAVGADTRPRWHYDALLAVAGPPGSAQRGPIAVLTVRIDLSDRLADLRRQLPASEQFYVLDSRQQLLLAPPDLRLAVPAGELLRWPQVFRGVASAWAEAEPTLRAWAGPAGTLLLVQARYQPNQHADDAEQILLLGQPQELLDQEVRNELGQRLRIPLAMGPVGLLLLYLLWTANQRQQRMRAERLRQARVLDQSRDAFIGLDGEQHIRSWNQGAQALFGWQADEVRGRPLAELLSAEAPWPRPQDPACRFETRVRRGGASASSEGEPLEVAVDWTPLQGEDGGGSLTLRDIGQERAAQRRVLQLNAELEGQVMARTADLLHERERLANILEGTHVGTWEWNVQTGEVRLNARWAEIVGYTLAELEPISITTWQGLAHPEDSATSGALLKRHFSGELPYYQCEARMRHREGHWVWVLDRGRVLSWTPEGRPEWMYGTHQDITELKLAQQQQQRAARLLQQVLAAATEISVIATDTEGLITVFNPGAERLLGYRADEMVGRQTPALLHLPEEVQARGQELSQAAGRPVEGFRVFVHLPEQQGSELRPWTYVRKDGSRVPVALAVTAMRDEAEHLIGYLGIALDISERRHAEQTLREAKQVAEAANAAKSLFLANMSHELRTPMNAVLGVAHLLQDTPLDAEQRTLLGKLQLAGRSLLAIINDVLDLAKIEAGELRLEQLPLRPQQLLEEVRALLEPQAQAKGLALQIELDPALPELISSDPQRLRQILLNLSSNAIKFTAQGSVRLRARLEHEAAGQEWLCWEVQDSGIGIAPEAQAQLFRPFVQADASTTRNYGGTGLGLAIVRQLSERLGGGVSLHSQPGQGSCFSVRLPLQCAEASSASGGLRVLVVEDEAAQREALAAHCRSLGWQVETLATGEALLQRLDDGSAPPPDVLLLDWQLGEGADGLSTLQQQVQRQGAASLPAVLVISAAAPERLRAAAGSEWADALLHKPVQPSELFNAVNRAVVRHTGSLERVLQATRVDALDAAWLPGVRVLVVDDSELNREVAQRLLSREGALVQTADGGGSALALLQASDPPPFDAVLMDVQMPGMDGLETTRRLRQLPGGAELPVLALTAGALEEERQRALAAGMDGFLTKPLEPAQLVRSLRQTVEARRREPLAAAHSAPALASAAGDDWPVIAGIDHAQSQLLMGGQRELFLQSLRRLLDEHLPALEAWQTVDLEAERSDWLARLHKLRGSAGQLGARGLHAAASAAEQALRSSAPTLPPLLDALRQALQALSQAAAPALQAAAQRRPQTSGPPPEGPAWQALLAQLRANDLEALSDYQRYLPGLAQALGAERAEAWEQQVANLQFPTALRLLEEAGLTAPDR